MHADRTLEAQMLHCAVQAYEHSKQLQDEDARLALLELEAAAQQEVASASTMQQLPRKKRRLHTSQKRLIKVAAKSTVTQPSAQQTDTHHHELQFMQSAKVLLDSVTPHLFATQQPIHVFIAFGSTASRPSELYSLAFPPTTGDELGLVIS